MILVRLQGGLGNQLFQYALGRTLAIKNNTRLKLDISSFDRSPDRRYGLSAFTIEADIASPTELAANRPSDFGRLMEKLKPLHYKSVIAEKSSRFNPNILRLKGNKCLIGYWQSEKYFSDIEPLIRQEITLADAPSVAYSALLSEIRSGDSVALHVRRGDYVNNAKFAKIFRAIEPNYYEAAAGLIVQRLPDTHFFIFSDDLPWVKDNLVLPTSFTLVNAEKTFSDAEELTLMASCRHNIIANSSFSWWGAWLNSNPDKIVIAPARWFKNENYHHNQDLIPQSWLKM